MCTAAGMCVTPSSGVGGSVGSGGSGSGGAVSTAGSSGSGGAVGSGSGYQIGTMCFAACASDATDVDAAGVKDGYGYEAGRSCVVVGSMPTLAAGRCEPPAVVPPADIPPGDGYYVGGACVTRCQSAATDPDPTTGALDGWGYESGASCLVAGSAPTLGVATCVPAAAATGDGYLVSGLCVPKCGHPELADAQGYGYEAQQTCVVATSTAATQNAHCMLVPRADLPLPGDGFRNGETCFPPCSAAALEVTAAGYGWEMNRTCIVSASSAAIQGVPCVPPASTLTGDCPKVLACPVSGAVTLTCGCTWIEGLAARKQTIMAVSGATQYFLASAMMETSTLKADYALGDGKTQDSFNAGLAKQNWGMIRNCHTAWSGQTAAQFMTATALNSDLMLDVQVYAECRAKFGNDWWSGHRAGYNNLGMSTPDILQFKAASDWTNQMLTGHLTDDVRFWVTVAPI
jgi:hypothetical protein